MLAYSIGQLSVGIGAMVSSVGHYKMEIEHKIGWIWRAIFRPLMNNWTISMKHSYYRPVEVSLNSLRRSSSKKFATNNIIETEWRTIIPYERCMLLISSFLFGSPGQGTICYTGFWVTQCVTPSTSSSSVLFEQVKVKCLLRFLLNKLLRCCRNSANVQHKGIYRAHYI